MPSTWAGSAFASRRAATSPARPARANTFGLERLDQGFFRTRWKRATPAKRRFLHAMPEDHDVASLTSEG